MLNSHIAKIDEVRPEQAAVVGDQGRAAQDSYAPDPDIWVVEKRAAQNSVAPDPDIWVVERSTSESPQPQKLDA